MNDRSENKKVEAMTEQMGEKAEQDSAAAKARRAAILDELDGFLKAHRAQGTLLESYRNATNPKRPPVSVDAARAGEGGRKKASEHDRGAAHLSHSMAELQKEWQEETASKAAKRIAKQTDGSDDGGAQLPPGSAALYAAVGDGPSGSGRRVVTGRSEQTGKKETTGEQEAKNKHRDVAQLLTSGDDIVNKLAYFVTILVDAQVETLRQHERLDTQDARWVVIVASEKMKDYAKETEGPAKNEFEHLAYLFEEFSKEKFKVNQEERILTPAEMDHLADLLDQADTSVKKYIVPLRKEQINRGIEALKVPTRDTKAAEQILEVAYHRAFVRGDEDAFKNAIELLGNLKKFNEAQRKQLKAITIFEKMLDEAESLQQQEAALDFLKRGSGYLEAMKDSLTAIRAIATLTGAFDTNAAEIYTNVAKVEAGIMGLLEVTETIANKLPGKGGMLFKYYRDATAIAFKRINQLADKMQIWREIEDGLDPAYERSLVNNSKKAPPITESNVRGGQPVFDYMWKLLMDGRPPATSNEDKEVKEFFYNNRNFLSIATADSRIPMVYEESNEYLFRDKGIVNFEEWIQVNRHTLWNILYGPYFRKPGPAN